LSELFKTSEIVSIQDNFYLELNQIAFEQMGESVYPKSSNLYEKINTYLQTLMKVWDTKSRILIASQNISNFKWEKSTYDKDMYLRNPFYHDDSKITLSPKNYNSFYDVDQLGIYITNLMDSPHGSCSVSISTSEAGIALTAADLSIIQTAPRIKFEFYSSQLDHDRHCDHSTKLSFYLEKKASMEIGVEGEEKFTYAFENHMTLPPQIVSNFRLYDIPELRPDEIQK
jgi:hypothetical protein